MNDWESTDDWNPPTVVPADVYPSDCAHRRDPRVYVGETSYQGTIVRPGVGPVQRLKVSDRVFMRGSKAALRGGKFCHVGVWGAWAKYSFPLRIGKRYLSRLYKRIAAEGFPDTMRIRAPFIPALMSGATWVEYGLKAFSKCALDTVDLADLYEKHKYYGQRWHPVEALLSDMLACRDGLPTVSANRLSENLESYNTWLGGEYDDVFGETLGGVLGIKTPPPRSRPLEHGRKKWLDYYALRLDEKQWFLASGLMDPTKLEASRQLLSVSSDFEYLLDRAREDFRCVAQGKTRKQRLGQ